MFQFDDEDFKTSSACSHCRNCVAVAYKDDVVAIRDTKDETKMTLQFTSEEWRAFIAGVKKGDFDF